MLCTLRLAAGKLHCLLPLHLCTHHVAAGSLLGRALGRGLINGAEDLHSNDAGRADYCYLHLWARDMQELHNAKRTCLGCSKGQGVRSDWQIDKGTLVRSHP